jgi:hypothetical protein
MLYEGILALDSLDIPRLILHHRLSSPRGLPRNNVVSRYPTPAVSSTGLLYKCPLLLSGKLGFTALVLQKPFREIFWTLEENTAPTA